MRRMDRNRLSSDPKPAAGTHYYYVRVTQQDGQMAWSSPMWVTVAK